MVDVFKIAEMLTADAIARHPSEIDLICYYGSHAQGAASAHSDLDLFYIPAEGCAPPISRTVLIEGVLFDFWPISWDLLQGFASGQIRGWSFAPALVWHARILHARSDAAIARLDAAKDLVRALQQPAARPAMIQRALAAFPAVLANWSALRLALASTRMPDVRDAGWRLLVAVCECLTLSNQIFFHRGLDRLQEQIHTLPRKPQELGDAIAVLGAGRDLTRISQTAEQLVLETRDIMRICAAELPARGSAQDIFARSYPEFRDGLRKVLDACARSQPVSASAAAWLVQTDLAQMLHGLQGGGDVESIYLYSELLARQQTPGFAEMLGAADDLAERAHLLDSQVRSWLGSHGIALHTYDSAAQFERALQD